MQVPHSGKSGLSLWEAARAMGVIVPEEVDPVDLYVTVEHKNEEQGLKQIRRIYDGFVKQRSTVATEEVAEDEASGEAGSEEAGSEEVGSEEEPTE